MEEAFGYKILTAYGYILMMERVNSFISDGYALVGGLSVVSGKDTTSVRYFQAVYKENIS